MSEQRNDGGPAFPYCAPDGSWDQIGMSLRDYFAAKAMPSALGLEIELRRNRLAPTEFRYDVVATSAYKMADAMLKVREAK